MSGGPVIFYGDPHGEWKPLLKAVQEFHPSGVVLLGDCDLAMPLREQLKPVFDMGIRLRWIPGNHDCDTPEWHDRLFDDYPEGNLHARWQQIGGLIVAGLGGIFKDRAWYPRFEQSKPVYQSRRDYLRQLRRADRWRNGMPLEMRDCVFPEDIAALDGIRADVLVCHEAPSCHRHGFIAIDDLAQSLRVKLVIHGHHHQSYRATLPNGIRVVGLNKAEPLVLNQGDLA